MAKLDDSYVKVALRYSLQDAHEANITSNATVDAQSAHKTSQNLGLANDSVSAPDYDMASLPGDDVQHASPVDLLRKCIQEMVFGSMEDIATQPAKPRPSGVEIGLSGNGLFATRDFAPGEPVVWLEKGFWIYGNVFDDVQNGTIALPNYLTPNSFIRFKNNVIFDRRMMETPSVMYRFLNHSMYPNTQRRIINPDGGLAERDVEWVATEYIRKGDPIKYMYHGCEHPEHALNIDVTGQRDPPRAPNHQPPTARDLRKRKRDWDRWDFLWPRRDGAQGE